MKFIESMIYGFISGISDILPISSAAHQMILNSFFGSDPADPVRNLFVHLAIVLSIYFSTAKMRDRINSGLRKNSIRRGKKVNTSSVVMEARLLKSAAIPFLIAFFLLCYILPGEVNLLAVSALLAVNGIVIYLQDRMLQGNKNAKVMSKLDGIVIGLAGALSAIPGLSRIGVMLSAAMLRGADRKTAVNCVLLLSIPALVCWIVIDFLKIISGTNIAFWSSLLYYIVSAAFAFLGTRLGIYILRRHIRNSGCAGYAFYCWGAALLSLILFLAVV